MSKKAVVIIVGVLLVVLAGVQVMASEGKKIAKDQVPKAVIAAFEKAHPKATVKEYEQKTKGAEVLYEVGFTEGAGTIEAKYKADGTLVGTEEDIAVKDLPEAVSKAVAAKYPDAKIKEAEKEIRGAVTTYEVKLDVKGKEQEVKFTDKGELVPKVEHKGK